MLSSRQKCEAASWGQDVGDMRMTLNAEACMSIRSRKRLRSAAQTRLLSLKRGPCACSHEFGVFQVAMFSLCRMNPSTVTHASLFSFLRRCIC